MTGPIPVFGEFSDQELDHWLTMLRKAMPEEQILPLNELSLSEQQQAQIAIVANPNPQMLAQCPNLIWVHCLWAGVEKLIPTFADSPIKLVRLVDPALANTMAEAVLTWCLYLHRNMHLYRQQQMVSHWQSHAYVPSDQRTVTILGLGELGQAAAHVLVQHGFTVRGWSLNKKQLDHIECFAGNTELGPALKNSDIVVCLLPLTADTKNTLNARNLSLLKPSTCNINFARGGIVDDNALLTALEQQKIAHAVLDVFDQEPLPSNHPYWQHPNVTVLPHISAQTRADTASLIVAQNIQRFRDTGSIPASVDFNRGY